MTTPTDLAQAYDVFWKAYKLANACGHPQVACYEDGVMAVVYWMDKAHESRAQPASVPDTVRDGINGSWNACCFREHCRKLLAAAAQPASVADGQKPVVHCERIDGIEHCLGGTQVAHLSGVHGHPRLGDIPWARTSRIVSIETKNTVYVIGKASAPQPPAQESE